MPPPPRSDIEPQTAIQEASDLASQDPEIVKKCWENLGTAYLNTFLAGNTPTSFPRWVLDSVPHAAIEQMINVVYDKGARKIESYGPRLVERFGVPQWQFVLFLGPLPQNKVTLLNRIGKRRDLTFDGLFEELCAERSKSRALPKGPFNFSPRELKCCVRDNDSEDEQGHISDDGHHNVDDISDIIVVSGGCGTSEIGSEHGDEDDSHYIPTSPINDDMPLETSSYVPDILDTGDASTVQEGLPESVETSTSDTDSLDNDTVVPTLEPTGTSDVTNQSRVALYSDVDDTGKSVMQKWEEIRKERAELDREEMAIRREADAVERKYQAYQVKRLRSETAAKEFVKRHRTV